MLAQQHQYYYYYNQHEATANVTKQQGFFDIRRLNFTLVNLLLFDRYVLLHPKFYEDTCIYPCVMLLRRETFAHREYVIEY